MVIDFDASRLPTGPLGWADFLTAIDSADAGDESEWVEFKAHLDPTTTDGRAAVAKGVVAFANRDPLVAARWLAGHAVIVIGLEPRNLVGAPDIDPADLHNKVNALLAAPAPRWEPVYLSYRDESVLLIVVDPPRDGDPIAVIGKSSGAVEDGHVYVRVVGQSARAKSADLRRLSTRLIPVGKTLGGITVAATGVVASVESTAGWMDDWLSHERARLLKPLEPPPPSAEPLNRYGMDLGLLGLRGGLSATPAAMRLHDTASAMSRIAAIGLVKHDEDRDEAAFRDEILEYLDRCRGGLEKALDALRGAIATEVTFSVSNHTNGNYEQVLVELHIEGDVFGYEWKDKFKGVRPYLPRPPRPWGPWEENVVANDRYRGSERLIRAQPANHPASPPRPRPIIINGGSVTVTSVPCHLRPGSTENLVTLRIVGEQLTNPVTVTWTATATNMSGKTDGTLAIPVAAELIDVAGYLEYAGP